MTTKELTDNLTVLSALKPLNTLSDKDLLTGREARSARKELEWRLRPTILLPQR